MSRKVTLALVGLLVLSGLSLGVSMAVPSKQSPSMANPDVTKTSTLVSPLGEPVELTAAWIGVRSLDRHSCASETCGVVGQHFFAERVDIMEVSGAWARITRPYDASCKSGRSEYISGGNSVCDSANGITHGKFAEWVERAGLTTTEPTEPAEPSASDTGIRSLIRNSDNFDLYETQLVRAAEDTMAQKFCTLDDFEQNGGWLESQDYKSKQYYFALCGGGKVYVDISSGEVWKR